LQFSPFLAIFCCVFIQIKLAKISMSGIIDADAVEHPR